MTSPHLKSRLDSWKYQVVRDLEKIGYMKIVEAATPAENVDESSLEKSTRLLEMSGGGRL